MYFPETAVTVDLDKAFLFDPKTAKQHVEELAEQHQVRVTFFKPKEFTATSLPDVPVNHQFMCCPRSISDLSTKIGLGFIGPKVRQIIQNANFPVLLPTPAYKEWNSILVFFGGSKNAIRALLSAAQLQKATGFPLKVFTKADGKPRKYYEKILEQNALLSTVRSPDTEWQFHEKGRLKNLLYHVPTDALVVVGAYGHGVIREMLFGSKMETIQTILPNNMLIVGPHC